MTAKDQAKRWGLSVVPTPGGKVLFSVGREEVAIQPDEARRFAYELASAYFRAAKLAPVTQAAAS